MEERKTKAREWSTLIRKYMEKRGMSVSDLSKASGVSRPTIYDLFNGITKTLTSNTIIAFVRALDIPSEEVSDLLDEL